ncbi:hypothetical protein ACFL5C_03220, partial [Candidatus Omnitrophota bacterium]
IKEKNILAGGKIVLYLKDEALSGETEKMKAFIEATVPQSEAVIIKQNEYDQLKAQSEDPVGEIEKLLALMPVKGVDPKSILAIVRGLKRNDRYKFQNYNQKIPLIMLNLEDIRGAEKGVFSFSGILEEAVRCINTTESSDPKDWVIMLAPIDKITNAMYEQYLIYRDRVLTSA